MALFGLWKKRSEEEEFRQAVLNRDYRTAVRLGERLLVKHPDSPSILNAYADSLVNIGEKRKAVNVLTDFATRKVSQGYYDVAIPVLKKVLKIEPSNVKALNTLIQVYKRKELLYEAFKVLESAYKQLRSAGADTSKVKELFETFLQEQFHPLFYEKYAELLKQEGKKEDALTNYVLAANMYENLGNYKTALRAFLKAREIRQTEGLDRQIVETVSHMSEEEVKALIVKLIDQYQDDPEFLRYLVSTFKSADNLGTLKESAELATSAGAKGFLLALIAFELGKTEEGKRHLERLASVNGGMFKALSAIVAPKLAEPRKAPYPEVEVPPPPQPEEVPVAEPAQAEAEVELEPETIDSLFDELVGVAEEPEEPTDIHLEVKRIEEEGIKDISMAEAMLGLGNYEKAIENAEKALSTKQFVRASQLISSAYRLQGRFDKALSFLMRMAEDPRLDERQQATFKAEIAEVYEEMGNKRKALVWYREANRVLRDPDIREKIHRLEKSEY